MVDSVEEGSGGLTLNKLSLQMCTKLLSPESISLMSHFLTYTFWVLWHPWNLPCLPTSLLCPHLPYFDILQYLAVNFSDQISVAGFSTVLQFSPSGPQTNCFFLAHFYSIIAPTSSSSPLSVDTVMFFVALCQFAVIPHTLNFCHLKTNCFFLVHYWSITAHTSSFPNSADSSVCSLLLCVGFLGFHVPLIFVNTSKPTTSF